MMKMMNKTMKKVDNLSAKVNEAVTDAKAAKSCALEAKAEAKAASATIAKEVQDMKVRIVKLEKRDPCSPERARSVPARRSSYDGDIEFKVKVVSRYGARIEVVLVHFLIPGNVHMTAS